MAHFMQPALLALFAPRPPLEHKTPVVKRKLPSYTGIASFVKWPDPKDLPPRKRHETPLERKTRREKQAVEKAAKRISSQKQKWNPSKDKNIESDAYKTLFVSRLAYDVDSQDLREEFEHYGDVKSIRIVKKKKDGTPRGYAFVEFKKGSDLKAAYRRADGRKIRARRIVVDVERGRTVKNWVPRKLGGGLGGTRRGGKDINARGSGRENASRDDRDDDRGRRRERSRDRGRRENGTRDSHRRDDRHDDRRDRDRDRDRGSDRRR